MIGTPVVGAVLCGGASSRFGADKALADAGGQPLGLRVVTALRDGGADPVVIVGGSAGGALGVPTIADRSPGDGPLAALASTLLWARRGLVVVAPCDLPLLSGEHVAALIKRAGPSTAAVAEVGGRLHPSLACWPASFGPAIQVLVSGGERAWRAALAAGPSLGTALPTEAVADADTPAELNALINRESERLP